ncbi:alpha-E domain-containing protein [Roseiterribacter gracilis]|uniref:DUF403 domain-containing protein n=1 Tax=Roseiterribacter gracilis TaxID=2812848 RepID=A0A8S8XAD3_9PROT|nr:hypothetical protein TMPK1_12590 [Rhodospirillales bacterium TMPK1]
MLSRTAGNLFWLSRYMERAESVARLILVGHRMAGVAHTVDLHTNEWRSTLRAAGCLPGFTEKYGACEPDQSQVFEYLVLDADNPSSIRACFETARRNARAVRTALTVEMWDAITDSWRGVQSLSRSDMEVDRLVPILEWVKSRSLAFSGAYANTMLRNEGYAFAHLGTTLERADNTARVLDVKYHLLLPDQEGVGGVLDYVQWQSVLRAVSALRAYQWVYHQRLQPWLVADLLILRPELPRSLLSCASQIVTTLDSLADRAGGRRGECHRLAGRMHAELRYSRIESIFQAGLHEFLTGFIDQLKELGAAIDQHYLAL